MDCVHACPTKTLECVGRYTTVEEVVREVRKDHLFYRNSDGGITVSGGEPLLQWKFTKDLLQACKEEGFHTALDTTGFASWEVLESVLKHVDLVLYDIKHLDESAHIKGTGVSNKLILENFKFTAQTARTWLRFPILPGFNDSRGHVEEVAQLGAIAGVEKVSLLPYHEWGKSKYEKLGMTYRFPPARMISDDHLEELKAVFEEKELKVTVKS
jgi:pyruvate formate lyase activating enzyme